MNRIKSTTIIAVSTFGLLLTGVARADCEADLNRLEQAFKVANLTPAAKAALEEAKTKSVRALRKDDDAACSQAVVTGLERAGLTGSSKKQPGSAKSAASTDLSKDGGSVRPLGDLSPFRTIAQDTLRIVDTGDLAAAKTRIKDLETSWDDAEPKLKPIDSSAWRKVDKAIDVALKELRANAPVKAQSADALGRLIAIFDAR